MKAKTIIAGAVLLVVLLFAGILFTFLSKPPQDITVRHIKSVQSSNVTTVTFEITNHATNNFIVYTWWVEASNVPDWKMCFDLRPQPILRLDHHGSEISTLEMTNLPTGSPLRLRIGASKELAGLETFFLRLRVRLRGGKISVNPFDKRTKVFSTPTHIFSDEFVEPELTSKANSEK